MARNAMKQRSLWRFTSFVFEWFAMARNLVSVVTRIILASSRPELTWYLRDRMRIVAIRFDAEGGPPASLITQCRVSAPREVGEYDR